MRVHGSFCYVRVVVLDGFWSVASRLLVSHHNGSALGSVIGIAPLVCVVSAPRRDVERSTISSACVGAESLSSPTLSP